MVLDISKLDFVLMYVKSNRGKGKTLFMTNYAIEYRNKFPNNNIYSNYRLNLKNAFYNPYMLLNYSELDNCLLSIDDIKGIKNFDYFSSLIANWSRKSFFHILISGQYKTHFKLELRTLAEYEVQVNYIKENDLLEIAFIDVDGNVNYQEIKNAVKNAQKVYNTYEKVPIATNTNLKKIIKEVSKNMDDLEVNLSLYFPNRSIPKLMATLGRELGFIE